MNLNQLSKTQKLTISGMAMALYIVVLYATQSFSFGAYQIRIATALYGLGYYCPFLILPLGIANLISNVLFGGLGIADMIGGCIVGTLTTFLVSRVRICHLPIWTVALPIVLIPGLGVSSYLSILLHLPYPALAFSLCVGQSVPAICSVLMIQLYERYSKKARALA